MGSGRPELNNLLRPRTSSEKLDNLTPMGRSCFAVLLQPAFDYFFQFVLLGNESPGDSLRQLNRQLHASILPVHLTRVNFTHAAQVLCECCPLGDRGRR